MHLRAVFVIAWCLDLAGCAGSARAPAEPVLASSSGETERDDDAATAIEPEPERGDDAATAIEPELEIPAVSQSPGTIDRSRQDAALQAGFRDATRAGALLRGPLAEVGVQLDASAQFVGPGTSSVAPPASCTEWIALEDAGGFLSIPAMWSGFDAGVDRVCRGLEVAARSRPATRSAVRGVRVGDAYASLPGELVWWSEGAPRLSDLYPAPVQRDPERLVVCAAPEIEGDRTCLYVEELGRADVDGDGGEDLVLFVTAESGGASTDVSGRVRTVGRHRRSDPLRVVDAADP